MRKLGISLPFWLLAACGGTVDAGDRERWSERIDPAQVGTPQTLYEGSASVTAYAVDDTTLYALVNDEHRKVLRLVSCPFENCAPNIKTLAEVPAPMMLYMELSSLLLSNGELFWVKGQVSNEPGYTILSCPTSGCPDGPRDVGAHLAPDAPLTIHRLAPTFAVDADSVYWWRGQSLMRCSRSDCQSPEAIVENFLGDTRSSVLLASRSYVYISSSEEISRARKDGSAGVEVITRSDTRVGPVSVGENGLFFPSSVLTGGIWRCPIEGCGVEPEVVVAGQRWPSALQLDDTDVYWAGIESLDQYAKMGSLARCPQSGCEGASVLASRLEFSSGSATPFVMNQDFLFWAEEPSPWLASLRLVRK